MKKRLKRLLSRKGLSLVEVLVVLIISSILILCATGMMTPTNGLMNTMKSNAHLDVVCDTANEYIRRRMQNAIAVSIIGYDSSDSSTLTAMQQQVHDYAAKTTTDYELKVNAIAILKNPDGYYRLYDFENVTESGISSLISGAGTSGSTSEGDYGVFNPDFYENTSYVMTFTNDTLNPVYKKDSDGNFVKDADGNPVVDYNTTNWIKVTSQSFREDGSGGWTLANQPKTLSYKVFGGNVDFKTNAATDIYDDSTKTFDFTKLDDGFAVIYITKNFNNYSPTSSSP